MTSRVMFRKYLPVLLMLLLTAGVLQAQEEPSANSLNSFGKVPNFELVGHDGKQVTSRDFRHTVWIADFIFTRCQGICPLMSGQMAELQKKLSETNVKLVSFSVDPEHDTSNVLAEYAKRYGAAEGRWVFLTGEKEQVRNLIQEGFHLGVGDAAQEDLAQGAELVMHSNRFVLVDGSASIRGYFDANDPQKLNELIETATRLDREMGQEQPLA